MLREGTVVGLANHTVLVARDGAERPIADSGAPIRDAQGAIIGVVLVFRDQTAEREAERRLLEGEARYRAVVRSVPLVQWTTDRAGVFTLSEGLGLAMLGLRPGEVVGRTVAEVYQDNPGVLGDFRRALAGETFQSENRVGPVHVREPLGPHPRRRGRHHRRGRAGARRHRAARAPGPGAARAEAGERRAGWPAAWRTTSTTS